MSRISPVMRNPSVSSSVIRCRCWTTLAALFTLMAAPQVARAQNLFVATFFDGAVHELSPTGTDLGIFASVPVPTGLAFNSSGDLFVTGFDNKIHEFSPT